MGESRHLVPRQRHEKAMDRAEAIIDRTEKKKQKSRGRARNTQERSKAWGELNKKMLPKRAQVDMATLGKEIWIDEHDVNKDNNPQPEMAVADDLRDLDIEDTPSIENLKGSEINHTNENE